MWWQVGASFGGMVGLNLLMWLPVSWNIQPGVYAVVAATAVLAGVFRSSISLVSPVTLLSMCQHLSSVPAVRMVCYACVWTALPRV